MLVPNALGKDSQAIDSLRKKEALLINNCVIKYCNGDLALVDIFNNNGYVSEMGLQHKRRIICLVQRSEEC